MRTQRYEQFVIDNWLGTAPPWDRHLKDMYIATAGLGGESGEVLEKLKKYVRDDVLNPDELKKELGDLLYYLTYITVAFGFTLEDIMDANYEKLMDRQARGVKRGSGDNR